MQLEDLDSTEASRGVLFVTSSLSTRRGEVPPPRVETAHDESRARLKLIVLGGLADTAEVLSLIDGDFHAVCSGEGGPLRSLPQVCRVP
ncbi:hypothetical protein [Amycolatopsis sp. H20-H5]|uniref:hypothetical protein n=1 Tax=Amycolatopsis sp. H20-H5 TaxID=3046309 RepID=UPI002DBBFA3D|nr:hypothetical protein [Amycolatopsis sp. H20-H5]MEC3979226.1 hypothetical protein [Amycolatopsis sp. H20-H5]